MGPFVADAALGVGRRDRVFVDTATPPVRQLIDQSPTSCNSTTTFVAMAYRCGCAALGV